MRADAPFTRRLRRWVLAASAVEVVGYAISAVGARTMLLYNLYWPLEFTLLLGLGAAIAPLPPRLLAALALPFAAIWGWSATRVDLLQELASTSVIAGALLQAGLYLYLFWHVAGTVPGRLRDAPAVWLCLAVLVYYGACGPLLGSINYFVRVDLSLALTLYHITQALCVLKFGLMATACLRNAHPAEYPAHEPAR